MTEGKRRILHGVAGFQILLKALDKSEHGDFTAAAIVAIFGVLLLAYAALHPKLHGKPWAPHLETGTFLLEAGVFAVTTATYLSHGKRGLPFCYLLVTIAYLGLAMRQHLMNKRAEAIHH